MSIDSGGNTRQISLNTDAHKIWSPGGDEISSLQPILSGNVIIFGLRSMFPDKYGDEVTDRVICKSVEDGATVGLYSAMGDNIKKIVTSEKDGNIHLLVLLSVDRSYDHAAVVRYNMKAHIYEVGNRSPFGRTMVVASPTGPGHAGITGAISGPFLYTLYTSDGSNSLHLKIFNWRERRLLLHETMADSGSAESLEFALINPSTFVFSNLYRGNLRFGRIYFDRDGTLQLRKLRTLALPQRTKRLDDEVSLYGSIRFFLGSRIQTGVTQSGATSNIFVVSFSIDLYGDNVRSYLVTIHMDQLLEAIAVQDGEQNDDPYQLTGWGWDDLLTTPWTKWGEHRASFELAEDQEPEYAGESEDTPAGCSRQLLVKLIRGSPGLGQRDVLVIKDFNRETVHHFSNQRHLSPNTTLLYPKDYSDPRFIEEHLVLSSLPCVETRIGWIRPELDIRLSGNIWLEENRIIIFVSVLEPLYWPINHAQLEFSEDRNPLEMKTKFK